MEPHVSALIDRALSTEGRVVVLTGAGISAESGIPTFRGPQGYWTVGSVVYRPEELATFSAFQRLPDDVWQWYLYRRTVCQRAQPNQAHRALVAMEEHLGERFVLITQNVDGLHLRAGNTLANTYQIHGNIDYMRCALECSAETFLIPEEVGEVEAGQALSEEQIQRLRCRTCDERARPHVLWFDESYNEVHFRFDSSLTAASEAALLIVVGTSASTTLPWHVVQIAQQTGATIIDINIDDNPFAQIAEATAHGLAIRDRATNILPAIAEHLAR